VKRPLTFSLLVLAGNHEYVLSFGSALWIFALQNWCLVWWLIHIVGFAGWQVLQELPIAHHLEFIFW
jgi:hypothetical protein